MNASPKPTAPAANGPQSSIAAVLQRSRRAIAGIAIISGAINLLALTGSFYMLQVYDRVLNARSVPTLVGLTLLMLGLYAVYGLLDMLRSHIMGRMGLRFDRALRTGVFQAVLLSPLRRANQGGDPLQPIRDLDQIRSVLAGPGPIAVFDAPWIPVYLVMIYLLHPWLGHLALAGALILILLTWLTERASQQPTRATAQAAAERQSFAESTRRNAEVARAIGLGPALAARWDRLSETYMASTIAGSESTSGYVTGSRVFRIVLQSIILGLGAYVVIQGEASGGVMIAASIMSGRALAPIESAIANWRSIVGARQSHQRLTALLAGMPDESGRLALPDPTERLDVDGLFVGPPGEARTTVHNVSFGLTAGDGLGIIGPSASGKSTLVRALVGAWVAQRGTVRIDGAALDQWPPAALGRHIGYLPQDIELFDGTIAENIARLADEPDSHKVIAAARAAGVHQMIVAMPGGYNAPVGRGGQTLSAGQRQRVALARALYDDPFFIVLDEPNSNLDADGDAALSVAITSVRERGGIVIVVAHRPSALSSLNKVLVLGNGQMQAFGPKDEILNKSTQVPRGPSATSPVLALAPAAKKVPAL